ncbi:hypothetical protein ACFL41_01385 [Gemmatimonadota bacterium]
MLNIVCIDTATSQSTNSNSAQFPRGITVEYGSGGYAITDENISREKYSGALPWLGVQWGRDHTSYHFRLGLEVRHSDMIRNYNVSTNITQFSLYQAFLYPLSNPSLFKRTTSLLAGPSIEIHSLLNSQDIAVGALGYKESSASLISLGTRVEMMMPLTSRFQAEGSLRAGILTLGVRSVDDERNDEPQARLLTALSGTHLIIRMGIRYSISVNWSCRLAYLSDVTWIKPWQSLLSASDTLVFGLIWEI